MLELCSIASKLILEYPELVLDCTEDDENTVVIRRKKMTSVGPTKHPYFNPRLVLSYDAERGVQYAFEVNLEDIESNMIVGNEEKVKHWLSTMHHRKYVICPGLPTKQYPPPAKRLKVCSQPLSYQRDKVCLMWHIPHNRKAKQGSVTYNMCTPCKRLYAKLQQKLSNPVKPATKADRASYSSSYPQSYLSPKSRSLRVKSILSKRYALERQIKKIRNKTAVSLNSEQNDDLIKMVAEIEHNHPSEIEKVMKDAEKGGKGEIMRALWQQDIKEHKDFFNDQRRCCEYMCMSV